MNIIDPVPVEPAVLRSDQPDWIQQIRRNAWAIYKDSSLPDRIGHLWRYTDPSKFTYTPNGRASIKVKDNTQIPNLLLKELDSGDLSGVVVHDAGNNIISKLSPQLQKSGAVIGDLSRFITEIPNMIEPYLGKAVGADFGIFEALNLATWNNGIIVFIPKGVTVEKPLHMLTRASQSGNFVSRTIVILGESSSLALIDEYTGGPQKSITHYINVAAETYAGRASHLRHLIVQNVNPGANYYFTHRSEVENDAKVLTAIASFGAHITKANFGSFLKGRGSESELEGFLLGEKRQHFDHHTLHDHAASNTLSNLNFKVVIKDRCRSAYTGKIVIDKNAPFSEAYQENRNLLLSSKCRVESVPELEINQNEVRCSHGAAMGPPDENQLFYLKSRGIPESEAVQLIVEGFMENALLRIPDVLQGHLRRYINNRLKNGWTFE